jgi:hypothetical protein
MLLVVPASRRHVSALFLSQTMTKMLFSVTPTDPATFVAVAAVLAGWRCRELPARAARHAVDPIVALRR